MDVSRFDTFVRSVSSTATRRGAVAGLLAAALAPLLGHRETAGKGKWGKGKGRKRRDRGKDRRQRTRAQAEQEGCWRDGVCIPTKGSNVSRCDLEDSTAFAGLDCTRCNLSRANLRGADLRGANLTKANLSGACLVDADFSGATFAKTTNLHHAIFCNTTMPDGSVKNSGCGSGTPCCPTCNATTCPNGCCDAQGQCQVNNNLFCGAGGVACSVSCSTSKYCSGGACIDCSVACPGCSYCFRETAGSWFCGAGASARDCNQVCTTSSTCSVGGVCAEGLTFLPDNTFVSFAADCDEPEGTGICGSGTACQP